MKYGLGRVKNIEAKGENAAYQHFFPLPTMFSRLNVTILWERVKPLSSQL